MESLLFRNPACVFLGSTLDELWETFGRFVPSLRETFF